MTKHGRIRVRGTPRNDIDIRLLAQALLMVIEDLEQARQASELPSPADERPAGREPEDAA
jgi:hypothetical protein